MIDVSINYGGASPLVEVGLITFEAVSIPAIRHQLEFICVHYRKSIVESG